MIIALLSIIAISEILRLVLTHKPLGKKSYFKQKRKGVLNLILDLEFKRFKTQEIREDIRREYDNKKSRLSVLEERIKVGPQKGEDIGEFKRLEDTKVILERDIGRYEGQMKQLDLEVAGSNPTAEYPDGVQGINQQIDNLRELSEMLKD